MLETINKLNNMKGKKTRNAGTMTEAAYFSMLRSGLRRTFRWWQPIRLAKLAARSKYTGESKQRKWSFQCARCLSLFKDSEVAVDHIVPVGKLRSLEDLPSMVERLTAERSEDYQVLCKPCHQIKTNEERG